MNTKTHIHGWWNPATRIALIAAATWPLSATLAQAEPAHRAQVTVEKKVSESTGPKLYQTGQQNIYIAPKGSPSEVAAALAAANGNIYAAAINNGNTPRGLTVVHEGGRTLLVANSSSPLLKTVRAKQNPPPPQVASTASPTGR